MNIDSLYKLGEQMLIDQHAVEEQSKVGTLRGGSAGVLLYGKTPIGNCARKSYLRYKGLTINDIELDRHLMLSAGLANEDIWAKILGLSLPEDTKLLREEEIPAVYTLPSGATITGRPDLVLVGPEGSLGIELKLVSSLWTARDVLVGGVPKLLHLIQAGFYSRVLNIPWELWYTSRVDYAVGREGWMQKLFTNIPEDYAEFRIDSRNNKVLNKITPFRVGYSLTWSGDQLLYNRIGSDTPAVHTVISWTNILAYYQMIADVDTKGILPPRPINVDASGKEGGYNMCDSKYCTYSEVCDKYETSLKKWLASIELMRP